MPERNPCVLLVDDDPTILRMLEHMLCDQPEAIITTSCLSVDAALAALEEKEYDVVVTDIQMPEKNGFVLLRALRAAENTKYLPVIVVTGDSDRTRKRQALELGATDLLNKPFEQEDLLARIRNSLRIRSYQNQLTRQIATLDRTVRQRTAQLEQAHQDVVWRLAKAGEYRDDQTGTHLVRVGCYCRMIAETLQMDSDFAERILFASPLHDIGKIGIPDSVLLKPGKLTPEEWVIMRKHSAIGAEILSSSPVSAHASFSFLLDDPALQKAADENAMLKMAETIALSHHEKWDGSGYPEGLVGLNIPIEARIVAVADAFDAMTSKRPYKDPMPNNQALEILSKDAGSHFDPDLVPVFRSIFNESQKVSTKFMVHDAGFPA